jgi:type I restriction enzyme S subunit
MSKSSLPNGWRVIKFGDVVDNMNETTRDPESIGLDRVVGLDHMDPESLPLRRWDNLSDLHEGTSFTRIFRSGQVLFGKRRAYQRKVALPDFDGICSGDILVFQPKNNEELLTEFLPYLVQSDGFFDHALGTSAGSLSPRTKWQELAKYEFALPPIAEQRRIVALLNQVDELVKSCELAQDHLIKLQLCKFEQLVNDSEYSISPLCDIADIYRGFSFSGTDYVSVGGINFLTLASVERDGGYKPNKLKSIEAAVKDKHKVVEGDLLVANTDLTPTRQFIGRPFLVPSNLGICAFSHHLTRVLPSDRSLNEWLYWELQSAQARRIISSSSRGSTVIMLDNKKFNSLTIRIPNASSRQSILEVMQAFDTLKTKLAVECESSTMLRKSILNSILNGSTNV